MFLTRRNYTSYKWRYSHPYLKMMRCRVSKFIVSIDVYRGPLQATWRPGLHPPQPPSGVPSIPCAQVLGKCLALMIKEKWKGAEDLFCFTAHILVLNNSPPTQGVLPGVGWWHGPPRCPGTCTSCHPSDPHTIPRWALATSWWALVYLPLPVERRGLQELEVPWTSPSSPAGRS